MFRWDFMKKRVCSKSVTKTLYRNTVLVSEWIFKLVCLCESCGLSEISFERDIAETALSRLLLLLVLKSSHQNCSVEKGVLENFTVKHLCWSLFLIKLQTWGPRTHAFSTETCKIFRNTYFQEHLYLHVTLFTMHAKVTANKNLQK